MDPDKINKNTIVDALSRKPRVNALTTIYHEELESLCEHYTQDPDFAIIWKELKDGIARPPYSIKDDILYHQ